jgi:hypothetical protein
MEITNSEHRKNTMQKTIIPTLNRGEVASRLGKSYRTVCRLEERKELLPVGRIGCELVYSVVDVDRLKVKLDARFKGAGEIVTIKEAKRRAGRGAR